MMMVVVMVVMVMTGHGINRPLPGLSNSRTRLLGRPSPRRSCNSSFYQAINAGKPACNGMYRTTNDKRCQPFADTLN